jgi:hypothetical protein
MNDEQNENIGSNPLSRLSQLLSDVPTLLDEIITFASTEEGRKTLKSGLEDAGGPDDDKVDIDTNCTATKVIKTLQATQNVVYIGNTTKIAIQGSEGDKFDGPLYDGAKNGKVSANIWVAGKSEPTHIIDGHHRWSAISMLNPDTEITGMIWIKLEPNVALAFLTAALRARESKDQGQGAPTGNVTPVKGNCKPDVILQELNKLGEDRASAFINKYKSDFNVEGEVVEKLASNLATIQGNIPANAPKRELMPQLGFHKTDLNLEDETIDMLTKGEVDVREPFAENTKWIKTYEQFRNKK